MSESGYSLMWIESCLLANETPLIDDPYFGGLIEKMSGAGDVRADLLPRKVPDLGLVCFLKKETDDEAQPVFRRADHRDIEEEHQAGQSAAELCRKHGISDATFYKWRSKYGGMEVSDAKKLKSLEDENRRLKKLLAEQMLDNSTLKEMLTKNF